MRRRDFIAGLSAAAWPVTARAQQQAMPVVGFVNGSTADAYPHLLAAFRKGLRENGFFEDRNVAIEYRWADYHYDRLPDLMADLVHRQVSVIAATGSSTSLLAAKTMGISIPIVFNTASDPVQDGIAASLNRPGGNFTGVTSLNQELGPKQLQLLHEVVSTARNVGALINPTSRYAEKWSSNLLAAAKTLGLQFYMAHASSDGDFDRAFETLLQHRIGGLLIANDPFFTSRIAKCAALCAQHGLPAIYGYREFATAGGLMSYGASLSTSYQLVGSYVGRILKGEKPADLPIQQATKIELTINLKTAKALGVMVPTALLVRADEVIE
jgi:putative tryptophan/tyrosine transport system substrate-binding protein